MKSDKPDVVVNVRNPSETPHCKFPEACDRTRKCEQYQRRGTGCGKAGTVHTWPDKDGKTP